jgi:hypothetical protein
MNKPTDKQIEAEIKKLTEMKPNVLRKSMFGDDHHAAIDAQIDVLRSHMTEDEVYDNYPSVDEVDEAEERGEELYDSYPDNVRDGALDAARWLAGESEDGTPSSGWKELVRK